MRRCAIRSRWSATAGGRLSRRTSPSTFRLRTRVRCWPGSDSLRRDTVQARAMIDVDLHLTLTDGSRRFVLAPVLASDAQVIAIYGASGAGKSLTLQAMAGLIRPERGRVQIAGATLFDAAKGIDIPTRARSV